LTGEADSMNASGVAIAAAPRERAEQLRGAALPLLEKGDFQASLGLYDRALSSAHESGDPAFIDWIYSCRAAAAAEAGPADEELVELKRILLRSSDPQTAFRAAYTSSRIYDLKRDFGKALFYCRIAGTKAAETGDALLIASAENSRGWLLTVDCRFEEAAAAFGNALHVSEPPAPISPLFRPLAKTNLGYCLISLDRIDEGLALVHEGFASLETMGAKAHTVASLLDLCFGYLKADRYGEARYFGEEALERLPLAADPTAEKNCLYLLGETCHLAGDEPAAQLYFDRLASLYPEFRNLRAYLEVFDFRNVINLRS
jgi:tetratricopeptide (TPR) repeat protein